MKLSTTRESLLRPLQLITGVVERRQTLPILGYVLLKVKDGKLSLTATDLEVEITADTDIEVQDSEDVTLPARKLLDICRTLPDEAKVNLKVDGERATLNAGRSRFTLSTLPVKDFPLVDDFDTDQDFKITQMDLKHLIDSTQFSMAQQDVRYYLNGLMLELKDKSLVSVATDGHRLSYCHQGSDYNAKDTKQIIIPRKGVIELSKLLAEGEGDVSVGVGKNHIRVVMPGIRFTSKLIDGKFPDYERVLPKNPEIRLTADRETLRQALIRTSILSNEKYRGIRFSVSDNKLSIQAHNPEQEEAEEEMEVQYKGGDIEIGFNVNYLLDALSAIPDQNVEISMVDPNSSCLLKQPDNNDCKYVIMPMRL
jgi:DNA polymerase-3 subunit beta